MKKILMLLAVAALFASCSKDSSVLSEQQKSKKQRVGTTLTVSLATTAIVDWTPDTSLHVDGAVYGQSGSFFGNVVSYHINTDTANMPAIVFSLMAWSDLDQQWEPVGNCTKDQLSGTVFDGYPGPIDTRIYRLDFQGQIDGLTDKVRKSEPFQAN